MGFGGEFAEGLPGALDPGVDGGTGAAEEAGHVVGRFPLLDEFDSPQAATLQFLCGPDRSHTLSTSETGNVFGWPGLSQ